MARYRQNFKDNAVARWPPPQSCPVETLSARIGIGVGTLERWRAATLASASSTSASGNSGGGGASRWIPVARLEVVIATAAMDEATRGAWCREQGLYPADLDACKLDAISGLGEPGDAETAERKRGRRRIKELESGSEPQGQGAGRNGRLARAVKKTPGDLPRRRGRIPFLPENPKTALPNGPSRILPSA
jgi:transposase